jgi:hypothetical protein
MTILVIITLILSIALLVVWLRWRQAVRADYIRTYLFPKAMTSMTWGRSPVNLTHCRGLAITHPVSLTHRVYKRCISSARPDAGMKIFFYSFVRANQIDFSVA